MRSLRIDVLMDESFVPPDSIEGLSEKEMAPWKTEYDVLAGLYNLGHDARPLAVSDDFTVLRNQLRKRKPHVVFNLLEEFKGRADLVANVLGFLELVETPYTGCNARALMVTQSKTLIKKILRYHRVKMPEFALFRMGGTIRVPKKLSYPLFVKSSTEHGSVGISQASIVRNDEELASRVEFVHNEIGTDAMAEEYIDGREIYVSVLGNNRLTVFPPWELIFHNLPQGAPRIATEKVKWDPAYQKSRGIEGKRATNLPDEILRQLKEVSKRVYRLLGLSGYARMDFRVTDRNQILLLEPNPNPQLEFGDYFADSAEAGGLKYETLLQRIISLGMRYHRHQPL
ncbi:MAG: D-alanine--D-alanine ligase family protein [Phycisphaerae bacterium]